MTRAHQHEAALAAAEILRAQPFFQAAAAIACYQAYKDEFATTLLIEMLWQEKKTCYLPVLTDQKELQFVQFDQGDSLRENQYSILEPENRSRRIEPAELDIVIVPLLAFDLSGNRLGTGGGYYDRTFAFLNESGGKKPLLTGLGYARQQTSKLPADPWDIKLAGILTENSYTPT